MSKHTQFWLSLIILGVFTLAVLFGPSTAVIGLFLWAGLTGSGIVFVRLAMGRRA